MAKSDVNRVTEETIARGGVLVKMYFDMRHTEREKLQPLMADLINERLVKERGVVYCYGAIEEPIGRDGVFITSAILTLLVDSFPPLVDIAFRYAPAGIEILKPASEMLLKTAQLQSVLMNLSDVSMTYSRYIMENVLKPEEIENFKAHVEDRAAIGKKILDSSKKEEKK
jgi:hypothetical protein